MKHVILRTAGAALGVALLLAACSGADPAEPPANPDPTPTPTARTALPEPDAQNLDDEAAAELYVAWREAVYGLPPTPPEAVEVAGAGDAIVVPGAQASDWLTQELELARERGVIVRGGVHAEPVSTCDLRLTS